MMEEYITIHTPTLMVGFAGEHYVMYDLLANQKLHANLVNDPSNNFDVIVIPHENKPLVRVQVKVQEHANQYDYYTFSTRKSSGDLYDVTDFEVLALVGLDDKIVAYFPTNSPKLKGRDENKIKSQVKIKVEDMYCNWKFPQ